LRTMSCTCVPGFTGKGDVHCDEISTFLFQLDNKTIHFKPKI
jgi:hypothetical protein